MYGLKQLDARLVQLKKDTDVDTFIRQLSKKADAELVNTDLKNHEFKLGVLDTNVMNVVNEMEQFTTKISRIIYQISELQEANKDVLLGKRKLNCLACGADNNKETNQQGADGKMYKSINPKSKEYGVETGQPDKQNLMSPVLKNKPHIQ